MADTSTYYPDIIRALVEHPTPAAAGFLVKGSEHPDAAEAARLKQTSCDVHASVVCLHAWYGGYRLSREFYKGDRAMRESGFDTSDRFGPFSGATEDYAPVGLNCLLYRYERDLEHLAHLLGKPHDAMQWDRRAQARNAAIQRYLWRPSEGVFADWDFVHARASNYAFITSLYPLWAGVATREEAEIDGREAQRFRAPRRPGDQQLRQRPAVGPALRLGADQLDRRGRPGRHRLSQPTPPESPRTLTPRSTAASPRRHHPRKIQRGRPATPTSRSPPATTRTRSASAGPTPCT